MGNLRASALPLALHWVLGPPGAECQVWVGLCGVSPALMPSKKGLVINEVTLVIDLFCLVNLDVSVPRCKVLECVLREKHVGFARWIPMGSGKWWLGLGLGRGGEASWH